MTLDILTSLFPLGVACVAAVGWLFRLEARVNAKADESQMQGQEAAIKALAVESAALKAKGDAQEATIKAAVDGHNSTTIEVVRLQEQIKHLTEVIERLLARDEPQAQRRRPAGPK